MRYPDKGHNKNNLGIFQTVMVPRAGKPFKFSVVPGASYASVGKTYVCSGFPRNGVGDIHLRNVENTTGTFDRISAWEHAVWEYV